MLFLAFWDSILSFNPFIHLPNLLTRLSISLGPIHLTCLSHNSSYMLCIALHMLCVYFPSSTTRCLANILYIFFCIFPLFSFHTPFVFWGFVLFCFVVFWDRVSLCPDWLQNHYVDVNDRTFGLRASTSQVLEIYRCVPPCLSCMR